MNRLQSVNVSLASPQSTSKKQPSHRRSPRRYSSDVQFGCFIPLHYEKNYAYPLIVWLHGPTGNESEINHVMPHISVRNFLGVCPRGVAVHPTRHPNGSITYTWDQEPQSVDCALEDVVDCIEHAKQRFNIASDRVFLVGNDTGGTMALRLALSAPQYFAGVASIGGAMPESHRPLASYLEARSMPVLLLHGRDSDQYPADRLCADIRLLHSAGMRLNVRQYPCGHEVTTKMLSDLNVWVMEKVAGVCSDTQTYKDPTWLRAQDYN